ncbi:MAG: glycerol-3-phosphate dehydrogenase/oxidase [Myxococcota bacterium]|nr:glycerol-3-phosphate dehydrogenase/oxidase [Myxococcota bacterium]
MDAASLGPEYRKNALRRLREERFDVVIVGGGVTGCGAALDAATRGLSVALIEQRDWAAGTSSRSSKLIHGGLRYLEQFDFALVREALGEQTLMLNRLCPHLVQPVPFLYPLNRRFWERFYIGAGTLLYDLLAGKRALPWHRHHTRTSARARFPSLRREALVGAIEYYDAQVDDARHTATLARTAAQFGAAVITSARVTDFAEAGGHVTGVEMRCLETGETIEVRGERVINATGVWTDHVQHLADRGRLKVRASKGIHLVVPRDRIHGDAGLILRTSTSVLFVIPWDQHWIIGTTDTDWNLDLAHPAASRRDIDYLLEIVNDVLVKPLEHADIQGVYAGLRPLLYGETDSTSQLSREHAVSESASGLISVAGGKYTTYRVMAKDAVDVAASKLSKRVPESVTHRTLLTGAAGYFGIWNQRESLARENDLPVQRIEHLLHRYGTNTSELLDLMREQPELREPIDGADAYLRAEAHYATSHEGALHLEDVLTRRTRISIETFDRGVRAARDVAALMSSVLGWDDETRHREIAHYDARVEAERESQAQPDDQTADATRVGAADVRTQGRTDGADIVRIK